MSVARLPDPTPLSVRQRTLAENAAEMAREGEVAGYLILVMRPDGSTHTAVYRPNLEDHKIGCTLFRAWAHTTLDDALL